VVQSTGDFLICFTRRYYFEQFVLQTVFIGAKKSKALVMTKRKELAGRFLDPRSPGIAE